MFDSFQLPSSVNATLFLVAGGPGCVDVVEAHATSLNRMGTLLSNHITRR